MELIDKQKLLKWLLNLYQGTGDRSEKYAYGRVEQEIESGTFDDHSAQEEIAKLKETQDVLKEAISAVIGEGRKDLQKAQDWADAVTAEAKRLLAKAIQAEQERDELQEAIFYEKRTVEEWHGNSVRYMGERNALLKGLKEIAEFKKGGSLVYVQQIKDIARSILSQYQKE